MELRELKSFLKIMEVESFSRAAKELGYSQSALSVQIHSLETELGVRLFDRLGKQVALTPPGKELARRVLPILQEVEEVENVMHNRPPVEALRIGMIESLCKAHMPQVMDYVCRNLPDLHITITIDSPSVLLDALNHNKVDLVYVLDKPLYDVKWEKVFQKRENIVFVCSLDSPLARKKEVELEEVLRQPFFLTEKADNYRLSLDHAAYPAGRSYRRARSANQTGTITQTTVNTLLTISAAPSNTVRSPSTIRPMLGEKTA